MYLYKQIAHHIEYKTDLIKLLLIMDVMMISTKKCGDKRLIKY